MNVPICAVITSSDQEAIEKALTSVSLFEIRIDLIGDHWVAVANSLKKPWVACNRLVAEGGAWQGSEARRKEELLKALGMGAAIIDLELDTPNLGKMVELVKKKARCLISHHEFTGTPPYDELKDIIERQIAAGADICKLVTTAKSTDDNLKLLRLYSAFPDNRLVCFCMGETGVLSRVLAPLAGAEFTYAAIQDNLQSASGQMTVAQLSDILGLITK
ncbi:3-dehydroquinate dehydratase I [Dehalogenimonas sp. WBC-2]|nr:3-dehydroquinate dehydratase I [Dehalogenimonas sp. WBC-2]